MYVRRHSTWTEIFTGHITCCRVVSHVEYAPRALLMLEKMCHAFCYG